jgi:hypothetical protein
MQTVLVYGINDDETVADEAPVLLASVQSAGVTANLTDDEMLKLFERLEKAPEPISGLYVRFTFLYLADGLPVSEENWRIGVLPSRYTDRCIQVPNGFCLQQLSVDRACKDYPVIGV